MDKRRRLPRLTDRIPLGATGLGVSPICLGMVGSPATVAAAFEAGINFFFISADMHWPYYEGLRRGLGRLLASRRIREHLVVAVVSYPTQIEFCSVPFLEVLEAVPRLGRIDVGVMGGVYATDFVTRLDVYSEHRRTRHAGMKRTTSSICRRLLKHELRSSEVRSALQRALVKNPRKNHRSFRASIPSRQKQFAISSRGSA